VHNLIQGLPQQHQHHRRRAQLQAGTAILLLVLTVWPLTRAQPALPQATPAALPVASLRALPTQPWPQHLQLWQQLAPLQQEQLRLTQLDFNQQRWIFYLQATELVHVRPWVEKLRQRSGLKLQLRSSEPNDDGYRIVVEGEFL
jgi:hypothetical protein